ncbi:hypothetical protein Clacol_010450 [Clathrus columnatus]|uniref:Uncharacterized protein n=1 Tax=Clathrus columnatus TaxID=1419009 RepID=A0AAV5ANV7_9AGAM|nr:hypothetical protein Clacol_010450 [Clathrus columnatus]
MVLAEFRQEIMKSVPDVVILLQQHTHSLHVRLLGIGLLTALSKYAEVRQVIANDHLTFLLTFLNDQETSVALAGLSLFEVLSMDSKTKSDYTVLSDVIHIETLVILMIPVMIPLIKEIFVRGELEMDHKGMAILLNISRKGEYKNTVTNMIEEVALDIANSFIRKGPFFSYFSPKEHTLEPKSSFLEGSRPVKYVNGTELLKIFSEKGGE